MIPGYAALHPGYGLRLELEEGADTRRTMFNRGEDGVRVKDGIAVRSGAKTAVLKRCG